MARCAALLRDQTAFSVVSDVSTEAILRDGRKLQLAASGTVTVNRARGFRFDRRGPFGATAAAWDGETLTIWAEALGGYASVARRTTRRVVRRTAVTVAALPAGCAPVVVNGAMLQNCGGVYYQAQGGQYVVVEVQ